MLKRPGQAAGWLLHLLGEIVLGLAVIIVVALGVLGWRLAEGPIDLGFLLPRLTAALQGRPAGARLTIGAASLAWQGFRRGFGSPLRLVLADVTLTAAKNSGQVMIPRAAISLSVPALLLGRIVPRRIAIEAPRLYLVREPTGALALAFGERRAAETPSPGTARLAGQMLAALAAPPGNDKTLAASRFPALSELRTLAIRDAELTLVDRREGITWFAPAADITLARHASGGLSAAARIAVSLSGQSAEVSLAAELAAGGDLSVTARLSRLTPAELAALSPALAPLAAVAAPLQLTIRLGFGPGLALRHSVITAAAGQGRIVFGGGEVPIAGGRLVLAAAGEGALRVQSAALRLAAPAGEPDPLLQGSGRALENADGTWQGDFAVAVDRVPMADLGRYWPPDVARGGRRWVVRNVTAGIAETAFAAFRFRYTPRNGDFALEGAYGEVLANHLLVHFLRPLAPLSVESARLGIESPDALSIAVNRAREGPLALTDGRVRITGLEQHDQIAHIKARVLGPVTDALKLLADPNLKLLSRHPLPLSEVGGFSDTTFTAELPLLEKLSMDQVAVTAKTALSGVRFRAGGVRLAEGQFQLSANNDGMELSGSGSLEGIESRLSYTRDFRAGPASAIDQRLRASATVTARELAQKKLFDATAALEGPIALSGKLSVARNGAARAEIRAGLTEARLALAPLGFVKPSGRPAEASAEIALSGAGIRAMPRFALNGPDIAVSGRVEFASGRPALIVIERLRLGLTDASGSIRFAGAGQPIAIVLQGPVLDLSRRFTHAPHPASGNVPARQAARSPPENSPPWTLEARFGRALLAKNHSLAGVVLSAASNGDELTRADLEAHLTPAAPVSLTLSPGAGGRSLKITAADAGLLLSALDVTDRIHGGKLSISATYADSEAGRPLAGTARISDFRLLDAPAFGRVLQAMTLYGLANAVSGPGLGFSELVAPFRLENDVLELQGARAYSPSLGLTLSGRIDLATNTAKLSGTIVPAYFFNSLLGRIPLIGRLFSPEKGSGLFAATYSIGGPLDNPKVGVNPLAALTPGFLRELFHVFD